MCRLRVVANRRTGNDYVSALSIAGFGTVIWCLKCRNGIPSNEIRTHQHIYHHLFNFEFTYSYILLLFNKKKFLHSSSRGFVKFVNNQ